MHPLATTVISLCTSPPSAAGLGGGLNQLWCGERALQVQLPTQAQPRAQPKKSVEALEAHRALGCHRGSRAAHAAPSHHWGWQPLPDRIQWHPSRLTLALACRSALCVAARRYTGADRGFAPGQPAWRRRPPEQSECRVPQFQPARLPPSHRHPSPCRDPLRARSAALLLHSPSLQRTQLQTVVCSDQVLPFRRFVKACLANSLIPTLQLRSLTLWAPSPA